MKLLSLLVLLVGIAFSGYSQSLDGHIAIKVDADEAEVKTKHLQSKLSGEFVRFDEDDMECYFKCEEHCDKDLEWLNNQDDYIYRKVGDDKRQKQ